jgi:hypothetical protein
VDAELAAVRQRKDRLDLELEMTPYVAGCREPEDIEVVLADVVATIAELEARREDLTGRTGESPAVAVPVGAPANDTASSLPVPGPPKSAALTSAEPVTPVTSPNGVPVARSADQAEYLTTRQAAALLGVSVKGLEALRARGEGPSFIRVGHAVRYATTDLRRPK